MRRSRCAHRGRRACIVGLTSVLLFLGAGWAQAQPSAAPPPSPPGAGNAAVLESAGIRVVYWPGRRGSAERTLAVARQPLSLPGISNVAALQGVTIVLAPSPKEFNEAAGGGVPDWSAGVAVPSRRLIVLPDYRTPSSALSDPAVVLRHEIAHLALAEYLPGTIPRWFTEGYATWVSGEWDEGSGWQIRLAFMLGKAPPLDSLRLGWPRGASRARLAYLLSASAVRFLATRGGPEAFPALLRAWRREQALDPALRSVYGITLGQFEQEWVRMVRRRYGWLLALSQVTVFWGLLTFLLLAMSIPRFRRKRAQLARLEREDRLLPPPPGWEEEIPDEEQFVAPERDEATPQSSSPAEAPAAEAEHLDGGERMP